MAISVENHQFNLENPKVGIRNVDRLSLTRKSDSAKINGSDAVRPSGFHADGIRVNTTAAKSRAEGQSAKQFAEEEDNDFEDDESVVWEFPKDVTPPDCVTDPRDVGTADGWIKRNPELVRLTGRHPLNCEPPLSRLLQYGFITPVSLHYVRNHGYVPRTGWEDWSVEVCGLVTRPAEITMRQLVEEFELRELPVTLVCAGNRRKEMNMVAQTIGFNWGAAAISTSFWGGARLCDVLRRCGILPKKKGALYVCFEGAETLPGGGGSKYGTSLNVDIAMDPARDVLLAYLQNGELLHPDHGFPVRMIIPGFIGGRMVKWLKRIVVTSRDSENYYHYHDNRVLPSHVDAERANSEEGWWYRPQYIINELNINSVITSPSHGEILTINSSTTQQLYTLRGYAYTGGGRKITRVEMTFDGGDTWNLCTVNHPEKPTKYGKHWCWCFWELDADVMELLRLKEFAVRAWDESMNTQPKELTWNVMGMMNNCWFRVKVEAYETNKGEIALAFEHPTLPGNQSGGWMQQKQREQAQAKLGKLSSTSAMKMSAEERRITVSEVEHHNSACSAWIIVHRHVYDCTKFLQDHPGGVDSILINAGSDCTEEFDAIHSTNAKAMLEDYRIGELAARGCLDGSNSTHGSGWGSSLLTRPDAPLPVHDASVSRPRALDPKQYVPCRLVAKTVVSRDVRLFRFSLPTEDHVLGLPAGKHILLSANINGKPCIRAYTPVSSDDEDAGFFRLLIKIYYKGIHPTFPAGGLMSQYLEDLPLGSESVRVKGPLGRIQYEGRGNFTVNGKDKFAKKIAMLAGGTGITPLYQIIRAVLRDSQDETEMYLVYASRTEDDILLRDELDKWGEKHSNFHVWYVISSSMREGWTYSLGIMNEEILRAHIPEGRSNTSDDESTLALMCGPPPMIQFACLPNLAKMNYDLKNSCFQF